ncbi:hypothetical protein GGTG_08285 [Gaeumannomyces tritici R3-111a-1]|uniref:Uncharacterized protein n=1 Tax=Gaeumannomyces tritici (strain R3-111a-1) TaxID=644352 RepID=J3P449_GAET3|nr:hypothetical protein GGTG_08285 [Gaeumannomyces tritici R3-111a-1]EJT74445.1 hypothetical protein GGTG_08285 [Gaeumannomyces tritici R3-111a-1]
MFLGKVAPSQLGPEHADWTEGLAFAARGSDVLWLQAQPVQSQRGGAVAGRGRLAEPSTPESHKPATRGADHVSPSSRAPALAACRKRHHESQVTRTGRSLGHVTLQQKTSPNPAEIWGGHSPICPGWAGAVATTRHAVNVKARSLAADPIIPTAADC